MILVSSWRIPMYVSFEYCTQTLQAFKDLLVDDFKTNTFSLCGGLLHSQCVLIVQACRVSVLTRSTLSGLDHFLNCFQLFFARVYLLDSFLRVMIFSQMLTISCHVAHWYLIELWLFHVLMLWLSSSTLQENARLEVRRGTLLLMFTMSQNMWLVISMQYWYQFKFALLALPEDVSNWFSPFFQVLPGVLWETLNQCLDSYCLLLIPFGIKSIIVWIYWHPECPISLYCIHI